MQPVPREDAGTLSSRPMGGAILRDRLPRFELTKPTSRSAASQPPPPFARRPVPPRRPAPALATALHLFSAIWGFESRWLSDTRCERRRCAGITEAAHAVLPLSASLCSAPLMNMSYEFFKILAHEGGPGCPHRPRGEGLDFSWGDGRTRDAHRPTDADMGSKEMDRDNDVATARLTLVSAKSPAIDS